MNFSRIALPVIGRPIVLRSILDREPGGLAQDPNHDRRGVSAAPEEVAQACGRADGIAPGPRPPREKIGRRQARGGGIEEPLRGYDRLKKGLAPAAPARGCMSGGLSSLFCSNDCSPVEKMPRTLRSKSSGLDAASRAVS